jgi:hypothetical protein
MTPGLQATSFSWKRSLLSSLQCYSASIEISNFNKKAFSCRSFQISNPQSTHPATIIPPTEPGLSLVSLSSNEVLTTRKDSQTPPPIRRYHHLSITSLFLAQAMARIGCATAPVFRSLGGRARLSSLPFHPPMASLHYAAFGLCCLFNVMASLRCICSLVLPDLLSRLSLSVRDRG